MSDSTRVPVRDKAGRHRLEDQVNRLMMARRDMTLAEQDAGEYAGRLLLSEYGLNIGEHRTFRTTEYPGGLSGQITRAEGLMTEHGVSICVHVTNGAWSVVVQEADIPVVDRQQ